MTSAERVPFSILARRGSNPLERLYLHSMYFCYFDDSSDPLRQRFCVCGGVLGHADYWDRFESRWIAATRELKEPFRSTDCECQHGQFESWEKTKCDALMESLVDLLCDDSEYRIGGFASIVPVPDFKASFPGRNTLAPYFLAVAHTILNMAHEAAKHQETVKLWFEDHSETKPETIRIYDGLRGMECWEDRDRLRGISFDPKELIPLQAADLVAREALKHVLNLGQRTARKPARRIWDRIGFLMWSWDELEKLKERGWPEKLESLTCWPGDWLYIKGRTL